MGNKIKKNLDYLVVFFNFY